MSTRAALAIWTLALLCTAGAIVLIATSDTTGNKLALILLAAPTGLAFVGSGIVARIQRPDNRTGVLLILVGFSWFLGALPSAGNKYVFTTGLLVSTLFSGLLSHLVLAFPTGRLSARTDRWLVGALYALVLLAPPLAFLFDEGDLTATSCDGPCPENVISVIPAQSVANVIAICFAVAAIVLVALVLARLVLRWRRASAASRRALAPVFAAAAVLIVLVMLQTAVDLFSHRAALAVNWVTFVALLAIPLAFLFGLLRWHLGLASRRLLADLSDKREPTAVRDALRNVLRDPTLELAFAAGSGYVDVGGRPLELPSPGDGRASTELGDAIVIHDESLVDQPELLGEVLAAAQIALERGLSLKSLETSDRRTSALLDAIPDNVYRVRADGTFLDAHMKQNVAVFGGPETFIGRTISDILPFDLAQRLMTAIAHVLQTGESERVEYELEFEGTTRHIEARIVWSDADEVVAITRDFSDLKHSEDALRELAEEQAALRRVATLAAEVGDRERERVFSAVTEEVGKLLGAQSAYTVRFEDGPTAVDVGVWAGPGIEMITKSSAIPLDSETPLVLVHRTGEPARLDSYEGVPGELAEQMRGVGWRAAVAAPIYVSGRLWGAICAGRTIEEPFPRGTERRIGEFARIVGISIANAEARERVASLAAEQAALSRVAVAVATATTPESVFDVVTEEVARLMQADGCNLLRFDAATEEWGGLVVGSWSDAGVPIPRPGERATMHGGPLTQVHRTGRAGRRSVDDPGSTPGFVARLRQLGITTIVSAPVDVSGELWGAIVLAFAGDKEPAPDTEERIDQFARLVAVALTSAEAREQLTASRSRIVQAGDAERRRLERNLHDGAQQRLVTLSLGLRLAQSKLRDDPAGAERMLEASASELALALEELRELARGLHPAVLSDQGLRAALEALATRAPVPVELDSVPPERLPPSVEAAAYYVVAEALTNVAKYADASAAHVSVMRRNGVAIVEVEDDGVGGADVSRGSGLRGLADRVEALHGRLVVTSEAGRGTRVRAEIPCE